MDKNALSSAQKRERVVFTVDPTITAVIIVIIVKHFVSQDVVDSLNCFDIYQTMLGLWGTILGFIFATAAILVSVHDTEFIKQLRESGNYNEVLFAYLISCLYTFVILVVSTFFYLFDLWGIGYFLFIVGANVAVFLSVGLTIVFFGLMILRR